MRLATKKNQPTRATRNRKRWMKVRKRLCAHHTSAESTSKKKKKSAIRPQQHARQQQHSSYRSYRSKDQRSNEASDATENSTAVVALHAYCSLPCALPLASTVPQLLLFLFCCGCAVSHRLASRSQQQPAAIIISRFAALLTNQVLRNTKDAHKRSGSREHDDGV